MDFQDLSLVEFFHGVSSVLVVVLYNRKIVNMLRFQTRLSRTEILYCTFFMIEISVYLISGRINDCCMAARIASTISDNNIVPPTYCSVPDGFSLLDVGNS